MSVHSRVSSRCTDEQELRVHRQARRETVIVLTDELIKSVLCTKSVFHMKQVYSIIIQRIWNNNDVKKSTYSDENTGIFCLV